MKLSTGSLAATVLFSLAIGMIAMGVACSAQQTAATVAAVEDISGAVCTELEANQQTDPAWVQFICSLVPKTGGPPKTFSVKVSKATSKAFAVDHCPSAGKVSP